MIGGDDMFVTVTELKENLEHYLRLSADEEVYNSLRWSGGVEAFSSNSESGRYGEVLV